MSAFPPHGGPPDAAATRNGCVTNVGWHLCKRRAHRAAHSQANRPVSTLFSRIYRERSSDFVRRIRSARRASGTTAGLQMRAPTCRFLGAPSVPTSTRCGRAPLATTTVLASFGHPTAARRRRRTPEGSASLHAALIPAVGGSSDVGFAAVRSFHSRVSHRMRVASLARRGRELHHRRRAPRRRDLSVPGILPRVDGPRVPGPSISASRTAAPDRRGIRPSTRRCVVSRSPPERDVSQGRTHLLKRVERDARSAERSGAIAAHRRRIAAQSLRGFASCRACSPASARAGRLSIDSPLVGPGSLAPAMHATAWL